VTRDQWDTQPAEFAGPMDLADNEDAAVQQLEAGVVAEPRGVHAAKTALQAFTPSELGEALHFRRKRARESAPVNPADARLVVSVPELQRAWRAVQAGQFRHESPLGMAPNAHPTFESWAPGSSELVVPVVGCTGGSGASTTALALASAAECPARILECRSGTTSGLAAASTAELGVHASGWRQ
jgi:Mrp family chromosome partitioning ATPase